MKNGFAQLYTQEGEMLPDTFEDVWQIYPRPHLRRDSFFCLNGFWDFTVTDGATESVTYTERIWVPFVPQSPLSGVGREIPDSAILCYRRIFSLPDGFQCGRVILHVDAADQICCVSLNGRFLGEHRGGYERFSLDVTDALRQENVVEIFVRDELEQRILPYGKQKKKRGGMWYTPISGIWQSVWLESVPERYVRELRFCSDLRGTDVTVLMNDGSLCEGTVTVREPWGDSEWKIENGRVRIDPTDPVLWSPEQPHLYDAILKIGEDEVFSYFALRSLGTRTLEGVGRLCLNGRPYFFHGLLDQGYFSDGIFLPADPQGYERDILFAKRMGFNMLRKHIKVEPEIFYYACDRLGMTVVQDMVNNGHYSFLRDTALPTVGFRRRSDRRMHRDEEQRAAFLEGMEATVRQLAHHPSICAWTVFNEGWGQFDHALVFERLKQLDSSRFIDSVSGWFMPKKSEELHSDVESHHVYFKPVSLSSSDKPLVLSEFGGYSYRVTGHCFNLNKNYGYRTFTDGTEFEDALEKLYLEEIVPAVRAGLCASVYTQLSDVEDETNGLITYDRKVEKVSEARMRAIADALQEAMKTT